MSEESSRQVENTSNNLVGQMVKELLLTGSIVAVSSAAGSIALGPTGTWLGASIAALMRFVGVSGVTLERVINNPLIKWLLTFFGVWFKTHAWRTIWEALKKLINFINRQVEGKHTPMKALTDKTGSL